jgi:hypothetical protein
MHWAYNFILFFLSVMFKYTFHYVNWHNINCNTRHEKIPTILIGTEMGLKLTLFLSKTFYETAWILTSEKLS